MKLDSAYFHKVGVLKRLRFEIEALTDFVTLGEIWTLIECTLVF